MPLRSEESVHIAPDPEVGETRRAAFPVVVGFVQAVVGVLTLVPQFDLIDRVKAVGFLLILTASVIGFIALWKPSLWRAHRFAGYGSLFAITILSVAIIMFPGLTAHWFKAADAAQCVPTNGGSTYKNLHASNSGIGVIVVGGEGSCFDGIYNDHVGTGMIVVHSLDDLKKLPRPR